MPETAYNVGEWSDFGVALLGAAAALIGLLFVAVSINLERIVAQPTLLARAAAALTLFSFPLVVGIWMLIPEQSDVALGAELIGTGVVIGAVLVRLARPGLRSEQEPRLSWLISRALPGVVIPAVVILAGATVIAEAGGGLYWIPPAVVIAFLAGLTSAWVLLVEILR
jgi:modulator of FtsH protease